MIDVAVVAIPTATFINLSRKVVIYMDKSLCPIDIAKAIGMSYTEFNRLSAKEKRYYFHKVHIELYNIKTEVDKYLFEFK